MYTSSSISLSMKVILEEPVIIETNKKTAFTVAQWLGGFFWERDKGRTIGLSDADRVLVWDFKVMNEFQYDLNTYQKLLDLINRVPTIIVLPNELMKVEPQDLPANADRSLPYTHLYRQGKINSISQATFNLVKREYSRIWAQIQNKDIAFISQYSMDCINAHVQQLISVKASENLNATTERQLLLPERAKKGCCTLL